MRRLKRLACYLVLGAVGSMAACSRASNPSDSVVYEGARLIIGDESPPIEGGAFVVEDGHITAVGRKDALTAPPDATHVDLTGKTVMPSLNNMHVHIGYEGYTSWSAENHTRENVLDHLQREAFYGVAVALTAGDQPTDWAIQFLRDQAAGQFPPAARFLFSAGMAPPGGGPDSLLIQGTTPLKAVYEISTGQEARAAVQKIAEKKISHIKIWVDDRDATRGSMQKMSPEIFTTIIDEAHKHDIAVHAHAFGLADQKAVVKAGADVLVHSIRGEQIDDEYVALLQEKKPYWTPVMGLGDRPEVCDDNNEFVEQVLPASTIADIREGRNAFGMPGCDAPSTPQTAKREEILKYNFPKMIEAGARLVLGTDAGVLPKYSFGWAEHHEIGMYVRLGLTPAQAIIASTSRPAELLGLADTGTLATGKRADFIVLAANPLENIRNTRTVESVYLRGAKLDRDGLLAGWKRANNMTQ